MRVFVLILLVAVGLILGTRLTELFVVSIRHGRVLAVRGRIPVALLAGFADVAHDGCIGRGTIRAVRGLDHARLIVRGVSPGVEQRLRNVFGVHPMVALRAAPPIENPNLGQILGWTWLAWRLLPR